MFGVEIEDVYEVSVLFMNYLGGIPGEVQRFLVLLVTIHWKTVVVK